MRLMPSVSVRLSSVVLALVVLVISAGAQGATLRPTDPAQSVTLSIVSIYDQGCRCYKYRLSGQISSGAANEYVTVMRQKCGYSYSTAVTGAQTRAGVFWEAELQPAPRPGFETATYRARWNGVRSEPVAFRGRLPVSLTKLGGGRYRVSVYKGDVLQDLKGRLVVLQRRVGGAWTRIQTARLVADPKAYAMYVATFTVRQRGWTLRALVPAGAAAPCFTASASEKWVS